MKKTAGILLASMLFASPVYAADQTQQYVEEGAGLITTFVESLKGELMKNMKEGGPLKAIEACKKLAPELATAQSKDGWTIGRTSLKVRNPRNAPEPWEMLVLQEFEKRKAAGEDPAKLVKAEIVEENGGKVFRMMKAIPMAKPCASCHGEAVDEKIVAKLSELYPEDKARGFKPEDLRGAFTLKKVLN